MIKIITILFLPILFSMAAISNEGDLQKFKSIGSIYGFKLSDSKVSDVFEKFGLNTPELNEEKHELAEVCIRNKDSTFGLILITGNIHDYETLYGYRLTDSPEKSCFVSDSLEPKNSGEIQLSASGAEVVFILGAPKTISSKEVNWKLDFKTNFDEPIVKGWSAGPENQKYTQVQTMTGVYHTVLITAKFKADGLSNFQVIDYSEADFKIENIYE